MNIGFKKAVALLAASALCISTGFFSAYAATVADGYNGKVGEFVYVQKDAQDILNTDNFFGSTNYNQKIDKVYMPGDTFTGSVDIKNENADTVNLYLIAGTTSTDKYQEYIDANGMEGKTAAQVQALANNLVKQIELTVQYTNASGKKTQIYKGRMGGASYNGKTMLSTINLGAYAENDAGKLDFTVSVPKTLSNEYNGAVAMIDWIFTAQQQELSEPSPGTGEEAIPYVVAAAACAISAIAILFVTFHSAKKEENALK